MHIRTSCCAGSMAQEGGGREVEEGAAVGNKRAPQGGTSWSRGRWCHLIPVRMPITSKSVPPAKTQRPSGPWVSLLAPQGHKKLNGAPTQAYYLLPGLVSSCAHLVPDLHPGLPKSLTGHVEVDEPLILTHFVEDHALVHGGHIGLLDHQLAHRLDRIHVRHKDPFPAQVPLPSPPLSAWKLLCPPE